MITPDPGSKPDKETSQDMNQLRPPVADLHTIGEQLLQQLPLTSIEFLDLKSSYSIAELRQLYPEGELIVCDFYIDDIETSTAIPGGFEHTAEQIKNIDHHAPVVEMFGPVSSGNLAIDYINHLGVPAPDTRIIIHHTDCDSVISSLIMRGIIPPHPAFAEAVIAADHTGEPNEIADLLQALDPKRDLNFSARNLGLLLTGQPLDPEAAQLLEERIEGRKLTKQLIQSGAVEHFGPVALVKYQNGLRNEFLPALLPDSAVIVMGDEPHSLSGTPTPGYMTVRLRLGMAAPKGFTIFDLKIPDTVDSAYGGRWNAGANRRGGGTTLSSRKYAQKVQQRYELALNG